MSGLVVRFTLEQLKHLQSILEATQESYQATYPVKFDLDGDMIIGQDGIPAFQNQTDQQDYTSNVYCLQKVNERIEQAEEQHARDEFNRKEDKRVNGLPGLAAWCGPRPVFLLGIDDSENLSKQEIDSFLSEFDKILGQSPEVKCDCGGHKVKVPCRDWCSTQQKG